MISDLRMRKAEKTFQRLCDLFWFSLRLLTTADPNKQNLNNSWTKIEIRRVKVPQIIMLQLVIDALRRTCYCMIAFLAFLLLMPNLPPYNIEFYKGMTEPLDVPFTGGLTPNHRLETAEPLSRSIRESSSLGFFKVSYHQPCLSNWQLNLRWLLGCRIFRSERQPPL